MINKSKIIILVTGTNTYPWNLNWKECESTWVPLLKQLGYSVKISFGDPNLEDYYSDDGDYIRFKTSDGKDGLLDKSIKLPIKWILEHTDYEYYFRIDSDSFVHPVRFNNMLINNITLYNPDYMGIGLPLPGLNITKHFTQYIPESLNWEHHYFASGVAYMVSRKIMPLIFPDLISIEDWELECDDFVLGRAMKKNNIQLLNDTSICFETNERPLIGNTLGIPTPYIGDKDSFLSIQHYSNGLMHKILVDLLK
jgi:hypothetical protein